MKKIILKVSFIFIFIFILSIISASRIYSLELNNALVVKNNLNSSLTTLGYATFVKADEGATRKN